MNKLKDEDSGTLSDNEGFSSEDSLEEDVDLALSDVEPKSEILVKKRTKGARFLGGFISTIAEGAGNLLKNPIGTIGNVLRGVTDGIGNAVQGAANVAGNFVNAGAQVLGKGLQTGAKLFRLPGQIIGNALRPRPPPQQPGQPPQHLVQPPVQPPQGPYGGGSYIIPNYYYPGQYPAAAAAPAAATPAAAAPAAA